jgi:hypothetical protein
VMGDVQQLHRALLTKEQVRHRHAAHNGTSAGHYTA